MKINDKIHFMGWFPFSLFFLPILRFINKDSLSLFA